MSLDGKIVIAFGAGLLASSYVPLFAKEGAKILAVGVGGTGYRLAEQVGPNASGLERDLCDQCKVKAVFDTALERYGRIDVIINGAGGNTKAATVNNVDDLSQMDPAEAERVMDMNFYSKRWALQCFSDYLRQAHHKGRAVNIASMSGLKPLSKVIDYSSAFWAVEGLTKSMAYLYGRSGIGAVNNVAVGFLESDQNRHLLRDEKTGRYTKRAREILAATSQPKFLKPKEVGPFVLFFADEEKSSVLNGVTLRVDLGFSLVDLPQTSGYGKPGKRR